MKITKKGFTLVELMVVIVIVGILAAVAIPKFIMASHKAKASEFPTMLMQVYTAEIAYQAESGSYSDIDAIGLSWTASKWFSYTVSFAPTTFIGTATVVPFGPLTSGSATIIETGARSVVSVPAGTLASFVPNW